MKLASTRLVVRDIKAVVSFYEMVTGQVAEWLAPVFAGIVTPGATLALGSAETVALFKEGSAEAAANRTAILEFMVDDVDAEFAKINGNADVVHEPKLMPGATVQRCSVIVKALLSPSILPSVTPPSSASRGAERGQVVSASHHVVAFDAAETAAEATPWSSSGPSFLLSDCTPFVMPAQAASSSNDGAASNSRTRGITSRP